MKRLISFLSLAALMSFAAQGEDNLAFHGTLVAPPCTVNNGQTIEVKFGDNLGTTKIDGINYKQPVNYSISCAADYSINSLAIVVETSRPASFDSAAVETDKNGLGIHISMDGTAAVFAKRVAITDLSSLPVIEAVPVQAPGVELTEGPFDATMTLRTDYM
ncbi:fimbrial protein [Cronobacter sakazakii]|uniref:fimbrial protein n=1 Tax=Cronobacter sakazakii TaxID=28141 RepID=UPI0004A91CF4|nr:fimbrial protein [Cronobacter sakazakii]AZP32240.1 pilus assembly protein [Cronobacter sakazakii]EGT5207639.1 pilus assembly protein [Cronobacter sakazakii]EGT5650166.1 pilus assembly protein [Cronobacter sakazakii]EGT5749992.1 pilus assembly protein [Cronobacter sakazakii]EGT5754214.1 pilus assembly protein [Cronobacter sakazakii]